MPKTPTHARCGKTSPNVILILVDDLGRRDTSCYGSSFYETPNLDQLAAESTRFTDAYAASPVCSPSRASILTGKYPARIGITDWIDWSGHCHPLRGKLVDVPYIKNLSTSECSLAQALREQGYATWHVGKWHLGCAGHLPQDHGFEINIGGSHHGSPGKAGYFSPWSLPGLENTPVPANTFLTDYITDCAIALIKTRNAQPFFLNLWHYSVHTPIQAPNELIRKYETKAKRLGLDAKKIFADGEAFPTENKRHLCVQRRLIQSDPVYAAMVENLDANIGRLMRVLKESGLEQETLVLFTSDNGGLATAEGSPTTNAPLAEGKGWMYEGGTRVPLLIRLPGIAPTGSTCSVPVTGADIYPTILELLGLPLIPKQHSDGESLAGLLTRGEPLARDAIFWHYPHYGNQGGTPGSSVRMGNHKLIEFFEDSRLELYDLSTDASEANNLADCRPELARAMHKRLKTWQSEVEATFPEANPHSLP